MSEEALTPPPSEVTKTEEEYGAEYGAEDYWDFVLEEGEFSAEEEEEEEIYYDSKDFISKPFRSGTLPINIVEFDCSYGYDCKKLFNLCVIDEFILIFASGNIIHFFNTITGQKWYRRSSSGCGIGHITKNPREPHIAVGEKGKNPLIIIYEWPSFEIVTVLAKGTKNAYTFLDYSPDGELLCSQGSQPDYMLVVWNWRKHEIMLRSKAYGQSVFNSRFSLYVPGHLTTSGIGHIKFWKINKTFTGLKLLGELGRFGKSEICNIVGFLALPDEKVVSGSEWGNILVWDGGLIRVEVFRRGKNYCHEAPITQFIYNNGDLTTIAMDGTIKVWYYETIELADPPEEEKFIEVEPIFEFEVGDYYHKAKLLVIVEADPNSPDNNIWYGQDGNGGIWKLDLTTSLNAMPPIQIFHCHAGGVSAIQCSPFSPHLASLGEDGRLFIYDYIKQAIVLKKEFLQGGCSLLWLPLSVEDSGCILIGGFTDGVIRVICVSLYEHARKIPSPTEDYINLIQVSKPHTKAVTAMIINPRHTILVTGSDDSTIFIYYISEEYQFVKLLPIGLIRVTGEVSHLNWKPKRDATVLVSCKNGTFCEMDLPEEPAEENPITYELKDVAMLKNKFVSIKSEIRRNLKIMEIKAQRQVILDKMRKELEQKAEDTGVSLDVDAILEAKEEAMEAEEIQLPDIYIPKTPSPILFASYLSRGIWLSMGGYDAGYIYECNFQTEGPISCRTITDADDTEISTYHYYHNYKYLILGMGDGKIRVIRVKHTDAKDFSDYWSFAMHDNDNGTINQICFNYNYSYMFTCGSDGNVFSYKFSPENYEFKVVDIESVARKGFPREISADMDDPSALSLEEGRSRTQQEEKMKEANAYKRDLTENLKGLEKRYEALLRRNAKLPASQQLSPTDLVLDDRILEDLENTIEEEMNTVKHKLAWQLEKATILHKKVARYFTDPIQIHRFTVSAISNKELSVESFRLKELGSGFEDLKALVLIKMEEQEAKGRTQAKVFSEEEIVETITRRPNPVEGLLKQIMVLCGDYKRNIKLRRLIRKYRERKDRLESRRIEWYEMMKNKPNPEKPDPVDVSSIEMAKETIGDYPLKTAPDYKVPKNAKVTTVHVYDQLLKTKENIYQIKRNYDQQVLGLRQKKMDMIERHQYLRELLLEIAKEIPKEKIRYPPNLPTYVEDFEFPERKFVYSRKTVVLDSPKRLKSALNVEELKKKEMKPLDKEYELLILEKRGQKLGKVHSRLSLMKYSGITGSEDIKDLEEAGKDDQLMTPWEKECKKLRVVKRLYEQDGIIDEMDTSIKEFDEEVVKLKESRYKIEVDLKLLELFLLTLHQEVLILKKFEAAEEEKENKLFAKLREKNEIQRKMNEINSRVEGRNRDIRRYEEEIKNLITMFFAATADNKFYDFLRRIFKKKYRPPKVKTDDSDSESESESSSSSEEEDAKSLDSKEIGPIRLDETVCPPGCDPNLYEWTFVQRSARHALELNITEEKKQIDAQKKELEALTKKIKLVDTEYLACKEDLEEYMREKQRNLNEVETVVILNMNQIQNFKSESEIERISESILFSSTNMSNLYKRVGELDKEIMVERHRHEKNRQHLTRMKIDVNHMKEMSVNLSKEIEEAMIKKFGVKVDIDDIEESILKRLVAEMHILVLELDKELDAKLRVVKQELVEKENEYARKVEENTERYNLLTVLQEEKLKIKEAIDKQDRKVCKERDDSQDEDVENLNRVVKLQEQKIRELRSEIARLKLKDTSKAPLKSEGSPEFFQKILIKTCDGELEEISAKARDEIRDICGEAQEIVEDAKEGVLTEQDMDRMKGLAMEMVKRLPRKSRMGVMKRVCEGRFPWDCSIKDPDKSVINFVENINVNAFILLNDVVKNAIESIITQLEGAQV